MCILWLNQKNPIYIGTILGMEPPNQISEESNSFSIDFDKSITKTKEHNFHMTNEIPEMINDDQDICQLE